MLNIKNKFNLFLAAFVFAASVSFSGFAARAQVLIDCSGKEGYALQICEEQKALAERNHKTDQKAAEAREAAKEAAAKAQEAKAAANKKNDLASVEAEVMKSEYEEQLAAKNNAQKEMMDAIAQGDTKTAQEARARMLEADLAAKASEASLNMAEKAQVSAQKDQETSQKEADKAQQKSIKAAEKAENKAQKDLTKANKELSKLQSKCEQDPSSCDVDKLQAAQAKVEAAKNNAALATQRREDTDGTTAAREQEALRQQELNKVANDFYDQISSVDQDEEVADVNVNNGSVSFESGIDSKGNPVSQQRCSDAKDNIFQYIACKAMTTLADVRVIVYTLAGFGLIAFAFAAIFNKISWKHLANLCIALFILSMMTPFISYFTQDNGAQITYGDYLPAGFTNINGSDMDAAANCDVSKGDVCPDVTVDTSAKDSQWTWKDLKNTVKSGISAARTTYDSVKTVKNTVKTTVNQAKKIGTAIKNTEGGLTGVLDTLGEVATASNTIFNTVKTGAGAVVANTSSIANDVQNAGKSGAELAFDKENQNRINELEKKLAAGNLSSEQQKWAKDELEKRKAAVDSNKVADIANNQGKKALDKINSVAKVGSTVTNIATKASNAAQEGATIGGGIGTATGDTLGAIFGVATAAGEGIGAVADNKQAKVNAANAEAKKQADAEAAAKRQEEIRRNNASYSQGKQWDNSYNANMNQRQQTTQSSAVSSGNSSQNIAGAANTPNSSVGSNASANNGVTSNSNVSSKGSASSESEQDNNDSDKSSEAMSNQETGNIMQPEEDWVGKINQWTDGKVPVLGGISSSSTNTTVLPDGSRVKRGTNASGSSYTVGVSSDGTFRYKGTNAKGNVVEYKVEQGSYIVDAQGNVKIGDDVIIDSQGNVYRGKENIM